MIIQKQQLTDCAPDISMISSKEKLLFFDIETTGFSPKTSTLYLVGAVFWEDSSWSVIQWMAESNSEEKEVLNAFFTFCQDYSMLVHFNGEGFDIPYLLQKAEQYELKAPISSMKSLDIYRSIRPFGKMLHLTHMNQKSLEAFLGIHREDRYTGGELIAVYHSYEKAPSDEALALLLLHNLDDLRGMLSLTSLLAFPALFCEHQFTLQNASWADAPDGQPDLILELLLEHPLPVPLSVALDFGYLRVENKICRLLIHAREGELKYFLPDHRNYYYIPSQDCVLHKSIASCLPASKRVRAKAQQCFQCRYGLFLPQKTALFSPAYQEEYKSALFWVECTQQFMNSPEQLFLYIKSLISI